MARLDANLTVRTGNGNDYLCSMSDNYTEIVTTKQKVDNTDGFIQLVALGKSFTGIGASVGARPKGAKLIVVKNNSPVGAEIQFKYTELLDSSNTDQTNSVDLGPDSATTVRQCSILLGASEYIILPNQWLVGYAEDASGGNAKTISNQGGYDVARTLEVDSTADVDTATDGAMASGTTTTTLYLEPYTSSTNCTANLFRVGDLVRLENEICEVTAIGDKSNLANNYLTVIRATHGSTAATHADDVSVDLPFFNANANYNKYTYSQTDTSGRFKSTNLFSYGRSLTYPSGIVKGSFAMKFYKAGYQELGLSGITNSSNSGLAVSTAYQFTIAIDGGSAYDLDFTKDSSNVNWGGANGILQKLNDVFQTQYYTAGNLFGKRVTVGIVDGDVRFTSGQRTRASAVALADSGGGDTDWWGVGHVPAVGSIQSAVAAELPDDTVFSKDQNIETKNQNVFAYDDGKGRIVGAASGTISYDSGALDFTATPETEFVVSFNYDSAHSGGINETSNQQNGITAIGARSCNSKIDAEVEILGLV